jgi:hypothetical protein
MNSQKFKQQFKINYKEIFAIIIKFMIYKIIFIIALLWLWTETNEHQNDFLAQQFEKIVYVVQLTEYEKKKEKYADWKSSIWIETVFNYDTKSCITFSSFWIHISTQTIVCFKMIISSLSFTLTIF